MAETLSAEARFEQEIKGSRFLAIAVCVTSPEDALEWLRAVQVADATHNCWAYKIGGLYRFNDDGEPGGSAGRPILSAIEGQGLDRVVCLVIRWYGGTKLGVGGLVRAYGGTAAECLRLAARDPIVLRKSFRLELGFEFLGPAHALLEQHSAHKRDEQWQPQGVLWHVDVPEDRYASLHTALTDATRGQLIWNDDD